MTRSIPQDVDMEAAVVGSMLRSDRALEKVLASDLKASMFSRDDYRAVFQAAVELAEKDGRVDEWAVASHLQARGELATAGGKAEVLALATSPIAAANVNRYIAEVRDAAILRSLVMRGEQIAALGYERPDEPVNLIPLAGQIIDEMTDNATTGEAGITTAADQMQPFVDELQERWKRKGAIVGYATGLTKLDERWGGLQPGRLIVIAGRPGMGKSALASGMAESLVFGSGLDVYVVNLEMREQEQIGRLMARAGVVDLHRATNGLPLESDVEAASAARESMYASARRLHMDQASDLTVAQIRQRARKLQRRLKREGRSLAAIVVDYLQLITPPAGERNETAALTLISRGLKSMALELNVPVIALSQLNRTVEERQPPRPRLSDLRGSGSIEQDADTVLFLFRPDYYLGKDTPWEIAGQAEAITAKMRGGLSGTDELRWEGDRVRFTDWDGPRFVVGETDVRGAA